MCGRFALTRKDLEELLSEQIEFEDRFNIAPSQEVFVFSDELKTGHLHRIRWGFLPHWKKDARGRQINARSESLDAKPYFRHAFRYGRCAIPASGYYEWAVIDNQKQPQYLYREDRQALLFAGLRAEHQGQWNGAIVTRAADARVAWIHERMPLILSPGRELQEWLSAGPLDAKAFLLQHEPPRMAWHAVAQLVNSPRNEGPECAASLLL
ncbi:MAG: SOS response-associated peptidase [Leptospiraceae bacterium]|nr:SOS response-associated peptidase [Leptospiraceae bacterium]